MRNIPALIYSLAIYGFIYLPVAVLVLFSFQESRVPIPPFNGPSLKWYAALMADTRVTDALLNSVIVAFASSAVSVVLGFLAAYALARHKVRFGGVLQALLTAPLTVSYLIIAMGLLITFNNLGIPKSLLTIGIGHVVINMPLCFAIIFSQMGAHQANMERAARDLGAAEWQVILMVSVPLLWPALFAAFFLSVTFSWDEFIIAFLVSRFDVTLPVEIWSMLRTGLNPKTNAVGSFVFLVSVVVVLAADLILFRKKKA
ncbi:ABC transporter permease [Hwanghaeella grinnelliae]|uniref:ABC transporter permease n=1 Tax=Hwanghaeella grinnelliae TaxID=2500179 RepID=A0A3S2W7Q2_9PROT|nr:ABC transporter permease [Hwanghaeella grinnelliae]RVU34808.1 ABC transporter permease [Hwanghaeella grinnelliae]